MNVDDEIKNRVAESGLINLDLETFVPTPPMVHPCDLSKYMESGFVLREKQFREAVGSWTAPEGEAVVALFCSTDAIVPEWAWMLATSRWTALGFPVRVGDVATVTTRLWIENVLEVDVAGLTDERVILRGCSDVGGAAILSALVSRLQPVVKTLMFGEACSTVPIYKRPATRKT